MKQEWLDEIAANATTYPAVMHKVVNYAGVTREEVQLFESVDPHPEVGGPRYSDG